jgi:hypothetical protein
LRAPFFAAVFRAPPFLAPLAAPFRAVLRAPFFAADFLAAPLRAVFFAAPRFAAVFLAPFFAAVFLAAPLRAVFFAAPRFAAVFRPVLRFAALLRAPFFTARFVAFFAAAPRADALRGFAAAFFDFAALGLDFDAPWAAMRYSLFRWPSRHPGFVITRRSIPSGPATTSAARRAGTGFTASCDTRSRAMSLYSDNTVQTLRQKNKNFLARMHQQHPRQRALSIERAHLETFESGRWRCACSPRSRAEAVAEGAIERLRAAHCCPLHAP